MLQHTIWLVCIMKNFRRMNLKMFKSVHQINHKLTFLTFPFPYPFSLLACSGIVIYVRQKMRIGKNWERRIQAGRACTYTQSTHKLHWSNTSRLGRRLDLQLYTPITAILTTYICR
jgi:hypothetical protein